MNKNGVPVGAKVTFRITGRPLVGRIMEDRGPIGIGGRHLYQVRYELGRGNWYTTEVPATEIENVEYKPLNRRRQREVEYITPFETSEGYSLFAKPAHARPLAEFLRSQELRFTEDAEAIEGEVNFLVEKSIPWEELVFLLNEWKREYAEGSASKA